MPKLIAEHPVTVDAHGLKLDGLLTVPADAAGLVIFAHGSGSSRFSPRNRMVAESLIHAGLATLLFDLLTEDEDVADQYTREHRFNIGLLGSRLEGATDWAIENEDTRGLPIGYFGASTGAAAAIIAAGRKPADVRAVVSRGGRPDLAGPPAIANLACPTLFIVGGEDEPVISLNREAYNLIPAGVTKDLRIVPGATHLFEEAGALEEVAAMASDWFLQYLPG